MNCIHKISLSKVFKNSLRKNRRTDGQTKPPLKVASRQWEKRYRQVMAKQGPTLVLSSKLCKIEMLFLLDRIELGLKLFSCKIG